LQHPKAFYGCTRGIRASSAESAALLQPRRDFILLKSAFLENIAFGVLLQKSEYALIAHAETHLEIPDLNEADGTTLREGGRVLEATLVVILVHGSLRWAF
jgi:hypothetical protein